MFSNIYKTESLARKTIQSSDTTDFRNYNIDKPNRYVPFLLPKDIEEKLLNLLEDLDLNTGSVDLIYDNDDNYVFLEINPVGQFGMVSINCNYHIEKMISEDLIRLNEDKNYK